MDSPEGIRVKVFRSAMEHLGPPQGTWISYEILGFDSRYLGQLWNTWVSLKNFRSAMEYWPNNLILAMKHLGWLWSTQVSIKVLGSAMEHLGRPQGLKIDHGTLSSASRYLDQLWNTWVSLKIFRSAMEHLSQSWQTQELLGWSLCFIAKWDYWVSLKVLGSALKHLS
jgi:hypothetical protein